MIYKQIIKQSVIKLKQFNKLQTKIKIIVGLLKNKIPKNLLL